MRTEIAFLPAALILTAALLGQSTARDFGVFVDGAYGRGETKMNELVDERIDRAKMIFDARNDDPDDSSTRVDTRDALETTLCNIDPKCGAGDSLTIVMMGHGKSDSFSFSEATNGSKKRVSAKKLLEWITKAADDDCCIRVVIFACHSGSFIDDLFEHPGMKAVYCSSRAGEKSYSDAVFGADGSFEDNGDWMDSFNDDWAAAAGVPDGGNAMEQATYSAWSDMPEEFGGKQHPTGWRRGPHEVRAHVVSRFGPNSRTARLHFYDPPFMRCQTQTVKLDRPAAMPGRRYDACEWVTTTVKFGRPKKDGKPRDPLIMCDPPADATAPTEQIVAHVEGRGRVHIIKPNWYSCQRKRLRAGPGVSVDPKTKRCSWINPEVTVDNGSGSMTATSTVEPFDYTVSVTAHVVRVRRHRTTGNLCIRIQRPSHLRFLNGPIYVTVSASELEGLDRCDVVRLDLGLQQTGDNFYNGSDVTELQRQRSGSRNFDSGVDDIMYPGFEVITTGEVFCPTVEIRNAGLEDNIGSDITVDILNSVGTTVFTETFSIAPLLLDESQTVKFSGLDIDTPGNYTAEFTTTMTGDENPNNNTLRIPFTVADPSPTAEPPDGWQAVLIGNPPGPIPFEAIENVVCIDAAGSGPDSDPFNPPDGDEMSFAFQELPVDSFVALALDVPSLSSAAAGIMLRLGSPEDPFAPFVAILVQGGNATVLARTPGDPNVTQIGAPQPLAAGPVYLGLNMNGNDVEAEISPDSFDWDSLGVATFPGGITDPVFAGPVCYAPAQTLVKFGDFRGFADGTQQPAIPTELVATALGGDSIRLDWSDNSLAEVGFDVECFVGENPAPFTFQLPPNTTQFTHSGLDPATVYTYRVAATTFFDHEEWSPPASAETHGDGLGAWAIANGVPDPFAGDAFGTPPVFDYFSGAPPELPLPPDPLTGDPLVLSVQKAPGTHDVSAELEMLVPDTGGAWIWETRFTIPADALPRQYDFELPPPSTAGTALFRWRVQQHPEAGGG